MTSLTRRAGQLLGAGLFLLFSLMSAALAAASGSSLDTIPGNFWSTAPFTDNGEHGSAAPLAQLNLRPITLAQLEDQLRRPEMQASIGKGSIAVLYPNVAEPFRSAFVSMIQGIEERTRVQVRSYAVDARQDGVELNAQLKRNNTRVVIALGRQGISTASTLDRDMVVLVGGALLLSDSENTGANGISLTPDPALLFNRLRTLLPDVRRVIVIYDPKKTEWLLRLARDAARAQGLELVAHEARDLGQAAHLYSNAFAGADNRRDAVWLPHDTTTVEEGTLLPLILKESWNSGVPVFSSNILHAKKGALFAMTPNNVELGRALANSALGLMAGETRKKGVQPLRELHTAINLRTASHMGLNIGTQQQRTFDFIYPEP
ncbi:MAG: ABC transporter substrate binding protein [Pseudomonadota bacterium]